MEVLVPAGVLKVEPLFNLRNHVNSHCVSIRGDGHQATRIIAAPFLLQSVAKKLGQRVKVVSKSNSPYLVLVDTPGFVSLYLAFVN